MAFLFSFSYNGLAVVGMMVLLRLFFSSIIDLRFFLRSSSSLLVASDLLAVRDDLLVELICGSPEARGEEGEPGSESLSFPLKATRLEPPRGGVSGEASTVVLRIREEVIQTNYSKGKSNTKEKEVERRRRKGKF